MGWEILHWSAAVIAIIGAALVSFRQPKRGLEGYSVANVLWIVWGVQAAHWPEVVMFSVFLILSVYGRWNWRRYEAD